eukprot:s1622_g16.t12
MEDVDEALCETEERGARGVALPSAGFLAALDGDSSRGIQQCSRTYERYEAGVGERFSSFLQQAVQETAGQERQALLAELEAARSELAAARSARAALTAERFSAEESRMKDYASEIRTLSHSNATLQAQCDMANAHLKALAAMARSTASQVRSRQALLYGLLQQTEDFHSNFQGLFPCKDIETSTGEDCEEDPEERALKERLHRLSISCSKLSGGVKPSQHLLEGDRPALTTEVRTPPSVALGTERTAVLSEEAQRTQHSTAQISCKCLANVQSKYPAPVQSKHFLCFLTSCDILRQRHGMLSWHVLEGCLKRSTNWKKPLPRWRRCMTYPRQLCLSYKSCACIFLAVLWLRLKRSFPNCTSLHRWRRAAWAAWATWVTGADVPASQTPQPPAAAELPTEAVPGRTVQPGTATRLGTLHPKQRQRQSQERQVDGVGLESVREEVEPRWGSGVHCRVHGGRRLYRAHASVGPFSVASRYDAKLATAERFRDVLCAMSKRVAVEQFFREALVEEPRKWGLNGREDMRLCFTASVSAKHWVGRSLATPRFAVTELEDGLRAWHKLRQARKSFLLSPLSCNVFNTSFLTQQELDTAWCSLSQALRSQHVHSHKRRSKKADGGWLPKAKVRHSVEERIRRLLRRWQPGLPGLRQKRCPRVPRVPHEMRSCNRENRLNHLRQEVAERQSHFGRMTHDLQAQVSHLQEEVRAVEHRRSSASVNGELRELELLRQRELRHLRDQEEQLAQMERQDTDLSQPPEPLAAVDPVPDRLPRRMNPANQSQTRGDWQELSPTDIQFVQPRERANHHGFEGAPLQRNRTASDVFRRHSDFEERVSELKAVIGTSLQSLAEEGWLSSDSGK